MIYGAGAVGGVVAGRLAGSGQDVAVIARGAHLDAIRERGLTLREPDGDTVHRVPAYGGPAEIDWHDGDVVVLGMKGMDTAAALEALPRDVDLPVVCLQNGVANERGGAAAAPRCVRGVRHASRQPPCAGRGRRVLRAGARRPRPGPVSGRGGRTRTTSPAGCVKAGFHREPRPDIMRWKYAKLLMNLGNTVEALCGRVEGLDEAVAPLLRRGRGGAARRRHRVLTRVRRTPRAVATSCGMRPVGGQERGGGSSWQSLVRGTGTVESDFLNGEIVLLGRLHGVPTPANEAARRLAVRAARGHVRPGSLTPAQFLEAVAR